MRVSTEKKSEFGKKQKTLKCFCLSVNKTHPEPARFPEGKESL